MFRFGLTVAIALGVMVFIVAASYVETPVARPRSVYFPSGALRTDPDADALFADWYAGTLRSMRMPESPSQPSQYSMFDPPRTLGRHDYEYRAIVSQDHEYLIAIRVFMNETPQVIANEIDLRGTGRTRSIHRTLTAAEWSAVSNGVIDAGVISMQHHPASFKGDCTDWVFESREKSQYNVLSTSCPTDPKVVALGEAFLNAAGWRAF